MEPIIGEIKMFAGNFAPRSWALCNGQLLAVNSNTALFSIIGTTYGGDGRTTFGLPDLRGRVPIHFGDGPGVRPYKIGQKGGVESVTLNSNQMPSHHHGLVAGSNVSQSSPSGGLIGSQGAFSSNSPGSTMGSSAVQNTGGGLPHTNLQPYLCINFIIAIHGVFPSRS